MNSTATAGSPAPEPFFGQPALAVAILTIVLSTLAAGARCWSRAVILGIFALEDWFLLAGWICAVYVSTANIIQLRTGLGRMFQSLSRDAKIEYLKIAFSINIVYTVALFSVKISVLCLYLRALKYDYVRLATKVMLVVVVISHIWILISVFTVCVPLDAFWDTSKRGSSYCHPFSVFWSHAGINIGTDFLIFAIPLTVLRKLRVPPKQKAAVYLVFFLAFGVCVISLVRTLQFVNGVALADRRNVGMAIWTMMEVNMAVICACLITIKPLVSKLFPRMLLSRPGDDDTEGIETIGHARQIRRNPLESDLTTTLGHASVSTATAVTEMADLETRKSRGSSGVGSDIVPGRDGGESSTTLVERVN